MSGRVTKRGGRVWPVPLLTVALLGCGDDAVTAPEIRPPHARAAHIEIVSGDEQEGWAGDVLPASLVVRVIDSVGQPVANVAVHWRVTSGEGAFGRRRFGGEPMETTIGTASNGLASVFFVPTILGKTVIEVTVPGSSVTPATFDIDATGLLIEFWISWESGFVPPCGVCDVEVPVGTSIAWVSRDADEWAVVAISAPDAALLFDSGTLSREDEFHFTPSVAGTWEYEDRTRAGTDWIPRGTITAR